MGHDDQDGLLSAMEIEQHGRDVVGRGAVEIAGRLVAEQQTRPPDQRSGDGRRAAARRRRARAGRWSMRPPSPTCSMSVRARGRRRRRRRARPASESARFRAPCTAAAGNDPETRNRSVALRNAASSAGVELKRIAAVERDRAGGRRLERAEHVEQRLLPLPDGPVIAAASPAASENDTSARMRRGPRAVA